MECLDVCYKQVDQVPIRLDVYPPHIKSQPDTYPRLPAVVYFHGGGLAVGNRTSWFPSWLKDRIVAAGIVFISADYRLIPSCTVHEVTDDVKDVFSFLSQDDLCFKTDTSTLFGLDSTSLAVAGSSSGGYCAYLAALYASPKPRAVLGLYATGGQLFTPLSLVVKKEVFYRKRELLDPQEFSEFLYPKCKSLKTISDSPLSYHPPTHPTRPGWWANPRMAVARLYLQLGITLDYLTGQHEPSLSEQLRPLLETSPSTDPFVLQETMKKHIPSIHHAVFPQLNVTAQFPPTFLVHGSVDTAVIPEESLHMQALLKCAGVVVQLLELYASHFDGMAEFLTRSLRSTGACP
ncbi:MYND finger domain-like protein [Favolaschia claudopus]|uniref:MYND finger domain-like protein n=1 Tax=Favolaschia claudopus TaxID=2862362 RepID=A0AAW0D8B9_9AGAR